MIIQSTRSMRMASLGKALVFTGIAMNIVGLLINNRVTGWILGIGIGLFIVGMVIMGIAMRDVWKQQARFSPDERVRNVPEREIRGNILFEFLASLFALGFGAYLLIATPMNDEQKSAVQGFAFGLYGTMLIPFALRLIPKVRKTMPAELFERDERERVLTFKALRNAAAVLVVTLLVVGLFISRYDDRQIVGLDVFAALMIITAIATLVFYGSLLKYRRP